MTPSQRDTLRALFRFSCGYCGISEVGKGGLLSHDHFQPLSQGGSDEPSNWVYACRICNEFKGSYWPQNEADFALLHPLRDEVSFHIRLSENGILEGLTQRGEFHIERLKLNRAPLVAHRAEKLALERERAQSQRVLQELRAKSEENERLRRLLDSQ